MYLTTLLTDRGKSTKSKWRNVTRDAGCGENLEVVNRQLRECRMCNRRVEGPSEVHNR